MNCPKHVQLYSKNKFEKLVHLVGFIISIYQDAPSPERQIYSFRQRRINTNRNMFVRQLFFCLTGFHHYSGYWFSVTFRHIYRFTASSGVRFFSFITLSTSVAYVILGLPPLFLPSGYQLNNGVGRLLSPTRSTRPYHFNMLYHLFLRREILMPDYYKIYLL